MRVRAPHGAGAAVEKEAHRALFAGPLGVEVHQDDLLADLLHEAVGDDEGVVGVDVEREAAHQVEHAHVAEVGGIDLDALAGALRREVRGAQDAAALLQIGAQLGPRPGVVAQRHHVRAGVQDLIRLLGRDTDDVGVLAVDDDEIDALLLAVGPQIVAQESQPGLAAHVAHGQDLDAHRFASLSCKRSVF